MLQDHQGGGQTSEAAAKNKEYEYWEENASAQAADRIRDLEEALGQVLSSLTLCLPSVDDRTAQTRKIKEGAEQARQQGYLVLRNSHEANGIDTD